MYSFKLEPQNGIRIHNQRGHDIDPEEAILLANGILNFYSNFTEEQKIAWKKKQIEDDLYARESWYGPLIVCKEFRKNLKRKWSFYCSVCRSKVTSNIHEKWWSINENSSSMLGTSINTYEKYCSEDCAKQIASQIIYNAKKKAYELNGFNIKET